MRCQTKEPFVAITPQGEVPVKPGQVVRISNEKLLLDLINGGKVTPLDPCPWRIWSELLQDHLWVAPTLEDAADLIAQGVEEPIYTEEEIDWLRGIDKGSLRSIHQVKKTFPGSQVQCHKKNEAKQR